MSVHMEIDSMSQLRYTRYHLRLFGVVVALF